MDSVHFERLTRDYKIREVFITKPAPIKQLEWEQPPHAHTADCQPLTSASTFRVQVKIDAIWPFCYFHVMEVLLIDIMAL